MARKRKTSEAEVAGPPPGFVLGSETPIEALSYDRIALTPNGGATVYLGYLNPRLRDPYLLTLSEAARQNERRDSLRFVELTKGGLFLTDFLWDSQYYRIAEDLVLKLPLAADSRYGVFRRETQELDEKLTRRFFGATQAELEEFLAVFHEVIRFPVSKESGWKDFTTTFSKTRDNTCHLSDLYIPQRFPFIRLGDTQCFGGHISLWGFYRQLALLCGYYHVGNQIQGEGFFQILVQHGAKPEMIVRLTQAGFVELGQPLLAPSVLRQFTARGQEV